MIITQEVYEKMTEFIMAAIHEGRKIKASDCCNLDFDVDAVTSLHSQMLVRRRKVDFKTGDSYSLTRVVLTRLQACQRENTTLLSLSRELGVGSYGIAKVVVDSLVGRDLTMSQIVENPNLIVDEWIRKNVLNCIMNDPLCSLEGDQLKECTGKEFEALLLQQLQARRMCFETEAELRNRGKPKTPDILLLIPMGVLDNQKNQSKNGKFNYQTAQLQNQQLHPQHQQPQSNKSQRPYVINWIDSKGMFADEETFDENYEQLKSYVNR